ncbi:MAG: DUF4190 domain-containing protein [Actinobacteria bacterium]|nr:DUF4190 domain-containing protein [Actinomycetota bacterium]
MMEGTPPPQMPATGPVTPGGMPPRPEKASGLATASLVLSILGIFCCSVPALAGVVIGIVELGNIKKGQSSIKGQSMAKAGVIIGIAALVINLILAIVLVATGDYSWEFNTGS